MRRLAASHHSKRYFLLKSGINPIKERQTRVPRYRCNQGHEFDQPRIDVTDVVKYAAHYSNTFVESADAVPVAQLKSAARRPSDQLSIEEIDVAVLESSLVSTYPKTRSVLAQFFQTIGLGPSDAAEQEQTEFTGSLSDSRAMVLRAIKARRGQKQFRDELIAKYNGTCVFTGCKILAVLEAAHVWPYRGDVDNNAANGLLLRADIHTLFDLDLIAIQPAALTISIAPTLESAIEYSHLHGAQLTLGGADAPASGPISRRWKIFLDKWQMGTQLSGE